MKALIIYVNHVFAGFHEASLMHHFTRVTLGMSSHLGALCRGSCCKIEAPYIMYSKVEDYKI